MEQLLSVAEKGDVYLPSLQHLETSHYAKMQAALCTGHPFLPVLSHIRSFPCSYTPVGVYLALRKQGLGGNIFLFQ